MPRYKLQGPDGRTVTIEAADRATALRGAQEWAAANPAPSQPSRAPTPGEQSALDYTRRIAGVSAMAAERPRPRPPESRPARGQQRAATRGQALVEDSRQSVNSGILQGLAGVGDALSYASGGAPGLRDSGLLPSQLLDQSGLNYTPQTTEGEYAQTTASMAPGAVVGGTSLLRQGAAMVLPGAGSETAGQIARRMGYDEGSEAFWRVVGALGGGVLSGAGASRQPAASARPGVPPPVKGRPEQVARLESARDLPVSVPLRRGDMTRNPVDQIRENMTLRGAYGAKPAAQMQEIVATQREALRGNVDAIAESIGAGARRPLREGGTPAAERLDTMRQRAEQWVNTAYDSARTTGEGAVIPAEAAMGARYSVLEGLNDFTPAIAPKAFGIVDELAGNGGPIQLRDVFTTRQRLSSLRADGGVEGAAAGRAVRALDGFISSAVDDGIVQGDPQAVGAWRQAIAANARKAEMFQGDDLIETLTERVSRNGDRRALAVDPREAGDAIFGVGNSLGRRSNQVRDLERMREVLGEGPEWNAVRAEHFQRLASRADGAMEGGVRQFSGANINKSWQDFIRDNRALADTIYTPAEQAQISRFSELAADLTSPVRGGDNPSNTAAALLSIMPRFIRSIPGLGQWVEGLGRDVVGNAVVRGARNPVPQGEPFRLPAPPVRALVPGAIAASTTSQAQARPGPPRR